MKIKHLRIYAICLFIILMGVAAYLFAHKKTNTQYAENKSNEETEVLENLRFLSDSRAYPNHDIPEDAYGKAYDFYKTHYANTSSRVAIAQGNWQSMGPSNVGGRTIGICIDPNDTNIVWLGSASGGMWKSTTGGIGSNAWTYVPTGFPVLGVSSIAINPNNSNIMYAGTGETYDYGSSVNGFIHRTTRGSNGVGILKSTDAGVTWIQSLNWTYQQRRGVWDIIINPLKPTTVYAATTEGVYKSINAGVTWQNILPQTMVMDLEIDKNDTNILYAGVGNLSSPNKGLYKTSNSGASWNILSNGLPANTQGGRISVATYDSNPHIVMCMIADSFATVGIYRSDDQGASWTSVNTIGTDIVSYQGWYAHCLMMAAKDSSHVFAGGVNLFESLSNGSFMNRISGVNTFNTNVWSDLHGMITNPLDANKIYLLTDKGLFRSDNLCQSFYSCVDGYNVSQMYIGSVSTTDSTIALAGLQDRNTQRYNGTLSWDPVLGGDGSFNAIDPTDDFFQFASSQYLNIAASFDQGFSFNYVYTSPASAAGGNPAAFIAPFVIAPSNTQVLYAGGVGIIQSTDRGQSWFPVGPASLDTGNKILSIAVSATNSDTLYCTTAPENGPMHVFLSADAGLSFTDISNGLPNRYPRDIAVNPTNSKELYVVFSGFGAGHIFKSSNAGVSWSDVSTTLPDLPFHCITIDPLHTDTIIAGCDFGVFISPDKGNTWYAYNTGLPEAVMVFDLVYSPSDRSVVAFTFGHGAYKVFLNDLNVGINSHVLAQNKYQKIFPNPVNNVLTIEIATSQNEDAEITIYDINGKIILNNKVEKLSAGKNKIKLNTSLLANGTYFVKTTLATHSLLSKFLVVK